ncbi:hypothetical protein BDAP_002734 [Binucleata daphniae]
MTQKKILLIHCGGTIGMILNERRYTTKPGFFAEFVKNNSKLNIAVAQNSEKDAKTLNCCNNKLRNKDINTSSMCMSNDVKKQKLESLIFEVDDNRKKETKRIEEDMVDKDVNGIVDMADKDNIKTNAVDNQCEKKIDDKSNIENVEKNNNEHNRCYVTEDDEEEIGNLHNVCKKLNNKKQMDFYGGDIHKNNIQFCIDANIVQKNVLVPLLNTKISTQCELSNEMPTIKNLESVSKNNSTYNDKTMNDEANNNAANETSNKIKFGTCGCINYKHDIVVNDTTYITPNNIEYEIIELDVIIDSSNAQLKDYYNILQLIKMHYNDYAGFVIIHGTDTMTYASSFISSMIKNLTKPIVFTGSITPMTVKQSEGINNIIKSITYANNLTKGVYVQFGQLLCDGSKISKVSVDSENAFVGCAGHSYYKSRFGDVYKDIDHGNKKNQSYHEKNKIKWFANAHKNNKKEKQKNDDEQNSNDYETDIMSDGILFVDNIDVPVIKNDTVPVFYDKFDDRIAIIKIYPNIKKSIFEDVVKNHRAIILETFGTGNGLGRSKEILQILEKYIKENNYVINVSQCLNGFVTDDYEANLCLSKIGVLSGKNMTSDALFCHLASILGNFEGNEVKYQIINLINNW